MFNFVSGKERTRTPVTEGTGISHPRDILQTIDSMRILAMALVTVVQNEF